MTDKPAYGELEQRIKELEEETVESKQTEETLRATEERFRFIYEESPVGIEIYDSKGQLLHANKACLDIFGVVDERQIKGFRLFDDPNLADKEKSKLRKGQMVRYEAAFDFDLVKKNDLYDTTKSGIAYLDVVITPLASKDNDGSGEYLVQVQDNTERKQAEAAAQTEMDKLETITQNIGAGLCIISKDYRTQWANKVLKQIFGEVEGKVCYETFNQQTNVCPNCGVREIFETGKEEVVHEEAGKDADGQTIWSEIIATPIRDKDGNIVSALELVVPITKRKQAEEKLKRAHNDLERRVVERTADLEKANKALKAEVAERSKAEEAMWASEVQFRTIFEVASVGIVQVDPRNGQMIRYNEKYRKITGYTDTELRAKKFPDLTHPDDRQHDWDIFSKAVRGEMPYYQNEKRYVRKDGSIIWVRINAAFIRDDSGQPIRTVAICEDITERKDLEEQLRQSHKMEAIGTLGGGIAHDLINMLGIILGNT